MALLGGIALTWILLETLVIGLRMPPGSPQHAALHLAWLWASSLFELAFIGHALDRVDGRSRAFRRLVWQPRLAFHFAYAKLVFLVALVPGLVMLVLPGLFAGARLGLFGFVITDTRTGGLSGMERSLQLTAGKSAALMILFFFQVGLNLLGLALLGMGLVVTLPLTAITGAAVYRRLQAGL